MGAVRPEVLAAWRRHLGDDFGDAGALRARLQAPGNLSAAIEAVAAPAATLTCDGVTVSHAELCERAARVGAGLGRRGIGPGSRVLIAGPSSLGFVVAYLATIRVGATAVLGDAAMTEFELARLLADSAPAAALADAALATLAESRRPALVADLGEGLDDLAAGAPPAGPPVAEPGPAILAYTSGTTGRPKAVPLSHANLLASVRGAMAAWRWRPDDRLVHSLPFSHQHGLSGVHISLLAGSSLVVEPRFDPARTLELIADPLATVLFAVPAMYERLDRQAPDRAELRLAVSGSAALPAALAERVAGWLGQVPLERYGSTEAGLVLSNLYDGPRVPGCVGVPLPGIETAVALADGSLAAPGEEGELLVRGPQVFAGYAGRDPGEDFAADGWFRSGDIARVEPGGEHRIVGRSKEMIVSGGLNVYPREVEAVLEGDDQVLEAVVVGLPSERWGERVVAVVRPAGSLDPERLTRFCRGRLSAYKCPKEYVLVAEIPRTSLGKPRRDAVLRLAAEAAAEAS